MEGISHNPEALGELVDADPMFAPAPAGLYDNLMARYQTTRRQMEQIAGLFRGDMSVAVSYFLEASREDFGRYVPDVGRVFQLDKGIAALDAAYWAQTLALTDVRRYMPEHRRNEWDEAIRTHKTLPYNVDTVVPTIENLLASRQRFFAEKIDGIFQGLSRSHVTNRPEGFSARMIVENVVCSSFQTVNYRKAGLISDLRSVIAEFTGRPIAAAGDGQGFWNSDALIRSCYKSHGEWRQVDGGTLRIRAYLKGTVHVEVHPDIAYRLNSMLAFLHPRALSAKARTRPAFRSKHFSMMGRPLPLAVVAVLENLRAESDRTFRLTYGVGGQQARKEAWAVLSAIGGVASGGNLFTFDYPAGPVIDEICVSGCVPDQQAHQFYPTPESLARDAIALADIGPEDSCLEPSAGQGGIADLLPKDRTQCVEISGLFARILEEKGFTVACADFLEWAKTARRFDRVVLNPPFSQGRALMHLQAAASLLAPGGRVTAILPASMKGKQLLAGFAGQWSATYRNAFAGTSAAVAIYTAVRS